MLASNHTPFLDAPGNFSFQQIRSQNGDVSLVWEASSRAATYAFTMGTDSNDITTPVPSCSNSTTICNLTGLDPNTTYYFSVVASNSAGTQIISNYGTALSVGNFSITSSSAGNGVINLSWGAADNTTSYDVIYGTSSGSYPTIVSNVTSPYVLAGLTNGVSYFVQVVARNAQNGYGLAGAEITQLPTGPLGTPTIVSITAPSDNTYSAGDPLNYTIRFSEAITVTGTPGLTLSIGAQSRTAVYVSGSGTTDLIFRYNVVASDEDPDGVTTVSPLVLSGGTLKNSLGGDADLTFAGATSAGVIVANAATITNVAPPSSGNYNRTSPSAISFNVTFSQVVNVLGIPRLTLNVGGVTRYATYASGSASSTLTFTYNVSGTDFDLNGISLFSPIDLNSGSIRNASGIDSNLVFTVPDTSEINVIFPNLVAWYDAQDAATLFQNSACSVPVTSNGQSVGCFRDKSGNNHHALQPTPGLLPLFNTSGVQALPSLRFDGVDDMMSAPDHADFNNMAGFTAVVVFVPQTVDSQPRGILSKRPSQSSTTFSMFLYTGGRMFFDIATTSNRQSSNTIFAINNPYLVTMHFDGSLAAASRTKFYIDASVDATTNSSASIATASTGDFHIGSLNANYGANKTFSGYIGEIFLFRRSLGTTAGNELDKVHQYLQSKWSL